MQKTVITRMASTQLPEMQDQPLLQRILQNRGVDSQQQLDLGLKQLRPYHQLKGIQSAVHLLYRAFVNKKRILIVGDFDADGATSTALCMLLLADFGFRDVNFLVPNRFEFGYGLSKEIVQSLADSKPDVIMTVDNGISSIEGVQLAQKWGIEVLITDHHLAGSQLPNAEAIVNPNQPGCEFENKSACGCAVAFYVMAALRAHMIEQGVFTSEDAPNIARRLDLVALATIADVVSLNHDNRILAFQGLARIKKKNALPGILALVAVAKKNLADLSAKDMGFAIAPRLNAAGRLDDMSLGINCLLAKDAVSAKQLAQRLDELNQQRRAIEASMQAQALTFLSTQSLDALPLGVCLFEVDWHEGVIGIVASRIKDKLHRPVIAFASAENGMLKGSGRSIPGFHMRDALDEIAKREPQLLSKFGGHAMAAGLSIKQADFLQFKGLFSALVSRTYQGKAPQATIETDGELTEPQMTLQTAKLLRHVQPWGQNFPEPSFEAEVEILNQRMVAEKHLKLVLRPKQSNQSFDGIMFNIDVKKWPNRQRWAKVVYQLEINEFRQQQNLQWLILYIE